MLRKGMIQGTLAATLLAAACAVGVVSAAERERPVDRDAAGMCGQLRDAARRQSCLQGLPTLSPAQERAQALRGDPAVEASLETWGGSLDAAMAARAQDLAAKGDVRSLLGAMLIEPTRFHGDDAEPWTLGPQERAWFARAQQGGLTDPLVAWVEVFDCHALDCDRGAALARLLRIDPDNAAVHLWAIQGAMLARDSDAAREQLRLAASARRFDPHSNQLLQLLLDARSGARLPPMDAQVSTVLTGIAASSTPADVIAILSMAQWAALATPPLQGLFRLCRLDSEGGTDSLGLQRDCIAVLSMIAANDATLFYAQLGARQLARMNPSLAAQWLPRLRQLAWWQDQSTRLLMEGSVAVSPAELAGRVAREGELVALSQLLARAGIPGTPPAEWELPEYYR